MRIALKLLTSSIMSSDTSGGGRGGKGGGGARRPRPRFVDRLRLGHLAVRPIADLLRRGERNANRVEVVDFEHYVLRYQWRAASRNGGCGNRHSPLAIRYSLLYNSRSSCSKPDRLISSSD